MPFGQRIIDPIRLGRDHVPEDYKFDLDIISNNKLIGCLHQLSSLAEKADSIFIDIANECLGVLQRTEILKEKVETVSQTVKNLNAKAVKVPVGDLATFSQTTEHSISEYGCDTDLFTPSTRNLCVQELYEEAVHTPLPTLRSCNMFRTDGKTGSTIFAVTPVVLNEKYDPTIDFDILKAKQKRRSLIYVPVRSTDFERKPKQPRAPRQRPRSLSNLNDIDGHDSISEQSLEFQLPTPTGMLKEFSRSQPSALVPIDTSGVGFNRLCEYRESQRGVNREYETGTGTRSLRKKKNRNRRQTVHGVPQMVFPEVDKVIPVYRPKTSELLRTRSASRERWEGQRSRSRSSIEQYGSKYERGRRSTKTLSETKDVEESNLARSCSLRRSLKSLFKGKRSKSGNTLWVEGRPESPGPPVVDLDMDIPMRRSRSLPRSLKSNVKEQSTGFNPTRSASTEGRLDCPDNEEEGESSTPQKMNPFDPSPSSRPKPSPFDPSSSSRSSQRLPRGPKLSKSTSHQQFINRTSYYSEKASTSSSRPQSLDVSSVVPQPIPVPTPIAPSTDSLSSTTSSDGSHHVRLNIPPGKPWAPFAVVKMRGSKNKLVNHDRQSSSGHWSGTTGSARQSLESNSAQSQHVSQTSLDKDSALSFNMHTPSDNRSTTDANEDDTSTVLDEDSESTLNGSVVDVGENFTKMSTDEWLKSNKIKKGKGIGKNGTLKSTKSKCTDSELLTMQNLKAHDYATLPLDRRRMRRSHDDVSSVYSVDSGGFWTSMHKDSGLYHPKDIELTLPEDQPLFPDEASSVCDSVISDKKSILSDKNRNKLSRPKRTPPPPPPRGSTILEKSNLSLNKDTPDGTPNNSANSSKSSTSQNDLPQMSLNDSIVSESDTESIYARVKNKTNVSTAAAYPSLCSVTPVQSDEEDVDMLAYSTAWRNDKTDTNKSKPTDLNLKFVTSTPDAQNGAKPHNTSVDGHAVLMESILEVSCEESGRSDLSFDDSFISSNKNSSLNHSSDSYCTWPRAPKAMAPLPGLTKLEDIVKSNRSEHKLEPPSPVSKKFQSGANSNLNFPSGTNYFNSNSVCVVETIPEVKTPEEFSEPRSFCAFVSSFKETDNQSAVSANVPLNVAAGPTKSVQSLASKKTSLFERFKLKIPTRFPQKTETKETNSVEKGGEIEVPFTGTWPRTLKSPCTSPVSPTMSKTDHDLPSPDTSLEETYTHTFPRKKDKDHCLSPKKRPSSLLLTTNKNKTDTTTKSKDKSDKFSAATARLIISSPVAGHAEYVDNPHKRSVCSPVSDQDFAAFSHYKGPGSWYDALPRKAMSPTGIDKTNDFSVPKSSTMFEFPSAADMEEDEPGFKPISKPMFPDLQSMKHSISFPVAKKEIPETNKNTWYSNVDTSSKFLKPPTLPGGEFSSNNSTSTLGQRRGSTASTISTGSSSSGKKSVTFATVHHTSQTSLNNKSDLISIGSSNSSENAKSAFTPVQNEETNLKRSSSILSTDSGTSSGSAGSNGSAVQSCRILGLPEMNVIETDKLFTFSKVTDITFTGTETSPSKKQRVSPAKSYNDRSKLRSKQKPNSRPSSISSQNGLFQVPETINEQASPPVSHGRIINTPQKAPTTVNLTSPGDFSSKKTAVDSKDTSPTKPVIENGSSTKKERIVISAKSTKPIGMSPSSTISLNTSKAVTVNMQSIDNKPSAETLPRSKKTEYPSYSLSLPKQNSSEKVSPTKPTQYQSSVKTVSTKPNVINGSKYSNGEPRPVEIKKAPTPPKFVPPSIARLSQANKASVIPTPTKTNPSSTKPIPSPTKSENKENKTGPPPHTKTVIAPPVAKTVSDTDSKIPNIVKPKQEVGAIKPVLKKIDVQSVSRQSSSEASDAGSSPRTPPAGILKKSRSSSVCSENNQIDLSKCGSNQMSGAGALSGSSTSLNKMGRSLSLVNENLAKSMSNLSYGSLQLSTLSLAKSTDSLSSVSSNAEKNRSMKLAFLNTGSTSSINSFDTDDRFTKHSLGQKKLSASRTSLSTSRSNLAAISENKDTPKGKTLNNLSPKHGNSKPNGQNISSITNKFQTNPKDGVSRSSPNGSAPQSKSNGAALSAREKFMNNGSNQKCKTETGNGSLVNRSNLLTDIRNHGNSVKPNGVPNGPHRRTSAGKILLSPKKTQEKSPSGSGAVISILDNIKNSMQTMDKKRGSISNASSPTPLNSSQEWE